METAAIEKIIIEIISKAQGIPEADIGGDHSFQQLGLDSMASMFLLDDLEQKLGKEINPMLFWEHPTVRKFAEAVGRLD